MSVGDQWFCAVSCSISSSHSEILNESDVRQHVLCMCICPCMSLAALFDAILSNFSCSLSVSGFLYASSLAAAVHAVFAAVAIPLKNQTHELGSDDNR